jgi:hypothetical protein
MSNRYNKMPDYCGNCLKPFSPLDWAEPAKAVQDHQLSGECPKMAKTA